MATPAVRELLLELGQRIQADRKSWQDLPFSCRWTIRAAERTGNTEVWLTATHAESPVVAWQGQGSTSAYACEASLQSEDFIALMQGMVSAQQLYLQRRLLLAGNWREALKLSLVVERFLQSRSPKDAQRNCH